MAVFILSFVFFLALTAHSSATFCVCKDGVDAKILQQNIDYACGNGADCAAIHDGGSCFNPNTVKDHCSYAVNSYYQRKGASGASCDFKGTATLTSSAPSSTSGCAYQSTAGGGSSTPSTAAPGTTTTGGTSTGTGTGTGTSMTPGTNPVFGLGPTGSGMANTDMNGATPLHQSCIFVTIGLLLTSFVCLRV